jgi:hypothetical protein
MNDITSKNT